MSRQKIEQLFPNLRVSGYSIESPKTVHYNCFAWVAGDTTCVWDPTPYGYWPSRIPRKPSLDAYKKAYRSIGYQTCQDADYEEGFEKIALYVDPTGKPVHAAKQLCSGKWTSKVGDFEDIEHDLRGLEGSDYGAVAAFMKKPIQN